MWSFRPEQNALRYALSARRLALPELPVDDFLGSVAALVRTDVDWVPSGEEASLYLRPFMIASEVFLGVRPTHEAEHLVIASPVGPYFDKGVHPVNIWISRDYARAGRGGTGKPNVAATMPHRCSHSRKLANEGLIRCVSWMVGRLLPLKSSVG